MNPYYAEIMHNKYKECIKFSIFTVSIVIFFSGGVSMNQILLIEDDQEIAKIIQHTLTNDGYHVTWATTGLEGLADFKAARFDLVLVDWMLPEMGGLQVIEHIRLESDIPVIMISARNTEVDKVTGLADADDYLAKPFSLEELKARVRAQLKRWYRYNHLTLPQNIQHFSNGLTIHWQEQLVYLNEAEVNVTQKEYDLLKLFAQHPLELFTKEALYQHIWQQADMDQLHTVTVHIKALREKLGDPVKNPHFIQTVWGKGYRFIGEPL